MSASESTAFEYLLYIDEKCVEHAGGVVLQQESTSFSHGLAFNVGKHQYLIPITDLEEVVAISSYTSLPCAPAFLKGITNVRGNLITMLDLHEFIFASKSSAPFRTRRALLVKQKANYFGLIVDSIIGMKSFHDDNGVQEVPEEFDSDFLDYISAFHMSGEAWYAMLSINNILTDHRFTEIK